MSIKVSNLTKVYGAQTAVNNISFEVEKGKIVGFLGPNGAGKSTTMKMITGYLQASAGTATVCDITVNENDIATKQKIGYLPESNALYYDMYVREYLQFVANIHQIKDAQKAIEDTIAQVGLTLEANKKVGQLSKGYKQRVGLAAAIIHNPEVLILDEPTSGLDPNQIIEIRNVIKQLGQSKTVLFSSHILQEVEAICDSVIIINKGTIVANDTLQNLQKSKADQSYINVAFDKTINEKLLASIDGVILVTTISNNNYQLKCTNADVVKKAIMQTAIDNNLTIASLQSETHSLESIFKSLTGK